MADIVTISHYRLHDMLLRALDEEIAVRSQPIIDGTPSTLDEYRYMAGIVRGLVLAQEIAEEQRRKMLGE